MNYGNKVTGGAALLTSTGLAIFKLWIVAVVIIVLALGTILYRHKTRRIK